MMHKVSSYFNQFLYKKKWRKQTHKKNEKNNEAKEVVSSSQYYTPALQLGLTDVSENKQKKKKRKTTRRSNRTYEFL
jgi:hypothetical protein